MRTCKICDSSDLDLIHLRTGEYVCVLCIKAFEDGVEEYKNQINCLKSSKPPRNRWNNFGVITLVLCILVAAYLLKYSIYLTIPSVFVGLTFYEKSSERAKKENQPFFDDINFKVEKLEKDSTSLLYALRRFYEQYWNIPPDWGWRRQQVMIRDNYQCQSCGRRYCGSKVPFHVHHIIPKSQVAGSHSVDNLQFLCEICHGKSEAPGHHLIKENRKKRLRNRSYN